MTDALFDDRQYAARLLQRELYGAPPLSILDGSAAEWQEAKKRWIVEHPELDGYTGRDEDASWTPARGVESVNASTDDFLQRIAAAGPTVSVFDPYLAEVSYRWWTAPDDLIYDPFSGGPARGVVARALERRYIGVDVRVDQIDANYDTTKISVDDPTTRWVLADSADYVPETQADFVYTCPPYGSLERYSDQADDLSTMPWPKFVAVYGDAIFNAVTSLKDDRFAAIVVGNYKESGTLRDLVGETVKAFVDAGARYLCDIVYMTPIGSSALRAQAHFAKTRRPMPRHQMLLAFVKGDQKAAARRIYDADPATPIPTDSDAA